MTTLTIDKSKEPDLAALVADKQPGDKITLHTSIKDNNPQTISLTVEGCEEGEANSDEETGEGDQSGESESSEETPAPADKKPEKSYGRQVMDAMGQSE